MLKSVIAIVMAAGIAALATLLSAPSAPVDAQPMAKPVAEAMAACTQRPWPYLNCVGTPFGNPRVRLVSTDRLAGN